MSIPTGPRTSPSATCGSRSTSSRRSGPGERELRFPVALKVGRAAQVRSLVTGVMHERDGAPALLAEVARLRSRALGKLLEGETAGDLPRSRSPRGLSAALPLALGVELSTPSLALLRLPELLEAPAWVAGAAPGVVGGRHRRRFWLGEVGRSRGSDVSAMSAHSGRTGSSEGERRIEIPFVQGDSASEVEPCRARVSPLTGGLLVRVQPGSY